MKNGRRIMLVIRECKETTMNTATQSIEQINFKHLTAPSSGKNVEPLGILIHVVGNINSSLILKNCPFFIKLNTQLHYDSAISVVGDFLKEMKSTL